MRRFLPADLEVINRWYVAHGKPALRGDLLPAHGVIEEGVAAGFLYRTDSSVCLLDGFVTNPEAGLRKRAESVECIAAELFAIARAGGFSHVIAICASRGIERIAQKMGLRTTGFYALVEGAL